MRADRGWNSSSYKPSSSSSALQIWSPPLFFSGHRHPSRCRNQSSSPDMSRHRPPSVASPAMLPPALPPVTLLVPTALAAGRSRCPPSRCSDGRSLPLFYSQPFLPLMQPFSTRPPNTSFQNTNLIAPLPCSESSSGSPLLPR